MSPEDDVLVARVLNAVPARSYEMTALLSVLRIEVTTDVPTACVSCERRPVLRINPQFVGEHCRTDEHLFMLVMHELHHVLLGHTRLFLRPTRAHNVAFDAVINSLLCLRFPGPAYTSFFTDLYRDSQGAVRLLAPPGDDLAEDIVLRGLHDMLYRQASVTAEEVFNAIVRSGIEVPGDALLLGSHDLDHDGFGTDGPLDRDVLSAIRSIVERWPPPENSVRGRSLSDVLRQESVAGRDPGARVRAAVRRALTAAACKRGGPRSTATMSPIDAQVAIPTVDDRRAQVVRSAGTAPLLYRTTLAGRSRRQGQRTAVYVDVSGSMASYLPLLYGALSRLRAHILPDVHLFSTAVKTLPLADVCRGRCDSTGGTDIECVLQHAVRQDARRVLVVTDGYTGQPSAALLKKVLARRLDLRVLLTPDGWTRDLGAVAGRIDTLPEIERRDP